MIAGNASEVKVRLKSGRNLLHRLVAAPAALWRCNQQFSGIGQGIAGDLITTQ